MNGVNYELYKVFYIVAKYKNLTKAATIAYISQPAITQSIKKLESQLGYKLFYRTNKGMSLTKDGEILFEYLKVPLECLEQGNQKIKEFREENNKILRIGSGTTLIKTNLIGPLKKFKEVNSNIKISIKHDFTNNLLSNLDNDLLDIVILNLPCNVSESTIIKKIEKVEDIFVANSEKFSNYKSKIYSLDELNDLPLVLQSDFSTARKYLNSICEKNKMVLNAKYELGSYGLILDFVREGFGIGFVNKYHVIKELKNGSLFEIKLKNNIPSRDIGVAINKRTNKIDLINEFINYLKEK